MHGVFRRLDITMVFWYTNIYCNIAGLIDFVFQIYCIKFYAQIPGKKSNLQGNLEVLDLLFSTGTGYTMHSK